MPESATSISGQRGLTATAFPVTRLERIDLGQQSLLRTALEGERTYRRTIQAFERLEALRPGLPNEPIFGPKPQQNTTTSTPPETNPIQHPESSSIPNWVRSANFPRSPWSSDHSPLATDHSTPQPAETAAACIQIGFVPQIPHPHPACPAKSAELQRNPPANSFVSVRAPAETSADRIALEGQCHYHLGHEPATPACSGELANLFRRMGDRARAERWMAIALSHR